MCRRFTSPSSGAKKRSRNSRQHEEPCIVQGLGPPRLGGVPPPLPPPPIVPVDPSSGRLLSWSWREHIFKCR